MTQDVPDPVIQAPAAALAYARAKELAASPDPAVRAALAAQADTRPELLFYLADDDDAAVRATVAANAGTPMRATARLARDRSEAVRRALAVRLARALPHLGGAEQAALRDMALHALELLAVDQVVRVRAALAGALKDIERVPPALAGRLARDTAREVAEPILRCCAALTDADLLALLAGHPEPWVAAAIASRPTLSSPVTGALASSLAGTLAEGGNAAAATGLLANPDISVSDSALDQLTRDSEQAIRRAAANLTPPVLPPYLVDRLNRLVEEEVAGTLAQEGFDRPSRTEIIAVTRRRLAWLRDYLGRETPEQKAVRLERDGALGEPVIRDALSWDDLAFVRAALALRTRIPPEIIRRMLDSQGPRLITALAWRAGLSMRFALALQAKAGVPPRRLLNARHGTDFPMGEIEMRWQLELFGVQG